MDSLEPGILAAAFASMFGLGGLPHDGGNLNQIEKFAAAIDSANYLNSVMPGCPRYPNDIELLAAGMARRSPAPGLVLEFGVYSGRTINFLASLDPGTVYGFDSFEGLPEAWRPEFPAGAFKVVELPKVAANVALQVGWFENTLPGFLAAHPGPVSFLHVDCDLYSSTKTVLHYLRGRIVPGTIIVFDEYFNYVGWRNHEFKAFAEFIAETGLAFRFIGAVPTHQQVGVVIC
jgi:hypothetical protein